VYMIVLGKLGRLGVYTSQPSTYRRLGVYASQSQCLHERGCNGWVSEHPQLSTVFRPTTIRSDGHTRLAFRAAIWVNSRCRATQIAADSYDVAVVLIHLKDRKLLLVACYEVRAVDTEPGRE
jgi:hypothetical protein